MGVPFGPNLAWVPLKRFRTLMSLLSVAGDLRIGAPFGGVTFLLMVTPSRTDNLTCGPSCGELAAEGDAGRLPRLLRGLLGVVFLQVPWSPGRPQSSPKCPRCPQLKQKMRMTSSNLGGAQSRCPVAEQDTQRTPSSSLSV